MSLALLNQSLDFRKILRGPRPEPVEQEYLKSIYI